MNDWMFLLVVIILSVLLLRCTTMDIPHKTEPAEPSYLCPMTVVVDYGTNRPWDKGDADVMRQQTETCKRMGFQYIRILRKHKSRHYGIICGGKWDCRELK